MSTQPRFLLLQARNEGDRVRGEERAQFAARLGVDVDQVVQLDLLSADLNPSVLNGYDALLVGGSGEYSVLDEHPGIHRAKDLLNEVAVQGFPTFASCFGFQLMVEGMGGEVIHDEDHAEVGTFELELTPDGADDPLFCDLPERFNAQLGHKDRAGRMPDGVVTLARSALCPHQALRVGDTKVYAAQFHPELTSRPLAPNPLFMGLVAAAIRAAEPDAALEDLPARWQPHRPGDTANGHEYAGTTG